MARIQDGVCSSAEIIGKQDRCGGGTPFALRIAEPLSWTSLEERRSSDRSPLWKTLPRGLENKASLISARIESGVKTDRPIYQSMNP
jgi:hypothetical protein